jgi:hypothetical protein
MSSAESWQEQYRLLLMKCVKHVICFKCKERDEVNKTSFPSEDKKISKHFAAYLMQPRRWQNRYAWGRPTVTTGIRKKYKAKSNHRSNDSATRSSLAMF